MARWPVLSIFSGAGGLDLGFEFAGFAPKLAVDISSAAIATYVHNRPGVTAIKMDLAKVKPETLVELWKQKVGESGPVGLIGGPPCQAFSISNVHQVSDDPRRRLIRRYVNILETLNSAFGLSFFVFENVPGLTRNHHRRRYALFKKSCEEAGFVVHEKLIDAGRFGIPQHRPRLVVVGINRKQSGAVAFAIPEGEVDPPPIESALRKLPEPAFCNRNLRHEDIPFHPNHFTMVPRSPKFANGQLEPGSRLGRSFRVLKWDEPSWTVAYGHREIHVHPGCHRRLSIFEAMLLQGFPESYEFRGTFSQQVNLISDTVPPPVGAAIGNALRQALEIDKNRRKVAG